jgi:thioredoxin-like negative regulator of GroEL
MTSDRVSGSVRRRRRGAVARLRLPFALGAVALAVFAAHSVEQRLSARSALAEAEEAFRLGDFVRAADRFQAVLVMDPASTAVRLRLAAAFAERSAALLAQASGPVLDAEARAGLLPSAFARSASAPEASGHPIANEDLRRVLSDRWSGTIAEGIDAASRAVAVDTAHEGAMLTLEGWHQLAAGLSASPDEYRRHMSSADEWRRKALAVRRLEAERSSR